LWEGARIEAGAVVRDVVLGTDAQIPRGARVEGAVIVRRDRVESPGDAAPFGDDQLRVAIRQEAG
jgi:hypothetical protein